MTCKIWLSLLDVSPALAVRVLILSLKRVLFSIYWLIALAGSNGAVLWWLKVPSTERNDKLASAVVGGFLALLYFIQKQKLEEARFFQSLFDDFNRRYREMNERLTAIGDIIVAGPKENDVIDDYFNLCAEEYLMFRTGYIPVAVWSYWLSGMRYYISKEIFRRRWMTESKSNSYYGFDFEEQMQAFGMESK
ncbi:MAG: hypothetical protein IPJ84_15310 [Bdellovibrionales bacterium]|nr:hypothetical protein [Bdellovibrionales bacterium]